MEILARLTAETGELAREVNHLFGTKIKKMYVWTMDCPECWKKRNRPTIIIFAEI